MTEKLKRCPVCKRLPSNYRDKIRQVWIIKCERTGKSGHCLSVYHASESKVISLWNSFSDQAGQKTAAYSRGDQLCPGEWY